MHDLWNAVSKNRVLEQLIPHLPPSTWVVGGGVRDMLLGREVLDLDLVTFSDIWTLAKKIETLLNGKAFWIDRERSVARIAVKGTPLTVDVLPPRGTDIESDLAMRDITINAMACDPRTGRIEDPLHGREDLDREIIRIISEENLVDDPLRGVRCLRFAVVLGFAVEDGTMATIKAHAGLIHRVSPERIKQEFMKALSCPSGAVFFQLLLESGYGEELFHPDPEMEHLISAERAFDLEVLLDEAHAVIPGAGEYLSREVEQGFSRAAALRFTAFLSGISGNAARINEICRKLSFSTMAVRTMVHTIEGLNNPVILQKGDPGRKDLCALFRSYQDCIPDLLLLACAAHKEWRDRISSIWEFYREKYLPLLRTPLVSGRDIMDELGIPPGPVVGKYLEAVEDARCEGLISSKVEALEYMKRYERLKGPTFKI